MIWCYFYSNEMVKCLWSDSQISRCPCLACGSRSLAGERCDRAGPSSRYEVRVLQPLLHCAQQKRWVTTDLGSVSFDPYALQAAFQDVDAETHFRARPTPRLVCSDRPEGRVLSWLNPTATQGIPAIRVWGSCMSVQAPAFRAPQPVGFSGQLGKEQIRANAEDLVSRHGVGFGQPDSTPHPGTCSVGAELPQDFIRQDSGPTETLSEAPGAYGCSCGDSSARSAPYETASSLAPWPNPEVGVETRYSPGSDYTGLPQNLQPVVRSLVPSGQECPWSRYPGMLWYSRMPRPPAGEPRTTGTQCQGFGRVPNCVGISIASSCWQYALPWAASEGAFRARTFWSVRTTLRPLRISTGKAVYAPDACRPPPPPLESEASEVPSCHPHSRSVQSGGRRAVSSSTSWGVETPSPGGPADLELVRSCSGRPVCISGSHPLPVVLFPIRGNARHGCTGTQLAPGPAQICVPPSEPASTDTVQDQGGRGAGPFSGSTLAQQDLVPGTHAPHDSSSLADSSEEGSAFSETGHPLAPASRLVETPCVVPGRDAEVQGDLPQEVALAIASARAPSTRRAYALKWNLFVEWCSSHHEDPRICSIRAVLSFLQQGLERRLSPSTLKVYVAAISAHHDPI